MIRLQVGLNGHSLYGEGICSCSSVASSYRRGLHTCPLIYKRLPLKRRAHGFLVDFHPQLKFKGIGGDVRIPSPDSLNV